MGVLSWIFPSNEDRVTRAKAYFERGKFADARMEVMGIESEDALHLRAQAENELARKNIEAAVSWCQAGDDSRARQHLEIAQNFHAGGLDEDFKEARRSMREIREQQREEEAAKRDEREARIAAMEDSPFHSNNDMSPILEDLKLSGAAAEELEGRLSLLIDAYPSELREHVTSPLLKAVLDLENGRPDLAIPALLALPDNNPLVCYERARAANLLGDAQAALRSMRTFDRLSDKHYAIGTQHTGILFAQALTQSNLFDEATALLKRLREQDPNVGGAFYAQLLSRQGRHQEAEAILVPLIQKYPRQSNLYGLLANVRMAAGHEIEAMRSLEAALEATHCAPGQCGYRPPDVGIIRSLATLYFERDLELERANELAEQAASLVKQPTWDDLYLAGLAARKRHDVQIEPTIQLLWEQTPIEHPRYKRLEKHLPLTPA
jgi:hypothetical protein